MHTQILPTRPPFSNFPHIALALANLPADRAAYIAAQLPFWELASIEQLDALLAWLLAVPAAARPLLVRVITGPRPGRHEG